MAENARDIRDMGASGDDGYKEQGSIFPEFTGVDYTNEEDFIEMPDEDEEDDVESSDGMSESDGSTTHEDVTEDGLGDYDDDYKTNLEQIESMRQEVIKLQACVNELIDSNRQVANRIQSTQQSLTSSTRELKEITNEFYKDEGDYRNKIQRAASSAARELYNQTGENIRRVAGESEKHIKELERESKRRVQRLLINTLPDKVFGVCKWLITFGVMILLFRLLFGNLPIIPSTWSM